MSIRVLAACASRALRAPAVAAACCLWLAALLPAASTAQTAADRDIPYRVSGDRIEVEEPSHWRSWSLPSHAVQVTDQGVMPRRFRGRYNLLEDRQSFARRLTELVRGRKEHVILNIDSVEARDVRGNIITEKSQGVDVPVYTYRVRTGISRVGSSPAAAANILDGDPSTYWEPDPAAPLDDWWIEVDLGRVVAIDSLVLRFVDPSLGDPFRQFRVLVAPDQEPILEGAKKVDFELVARTAGPNAQRVLAFGLGQLRISPEWTGRLVETLRIVVTDSRRGRGAQIRQAEWEALDPAERGDIVYYVRAVEGFEEPEERSVYDSLPAERQGRKEYYRRERPRLADVEVLGAGDNLSLGIVDGGGSVSLSGGGFSPGAGFDGDYATNFVHTVREKTSIVDRGVLTIDMGATFWLDAMRLSSTSESTDGYLVEHSDGSLDASGRPVWRRLSPREREDLSVDRFENILDLYRPPRRARFLRMITFSSGLRSIYYQGPEVAEYQLFSEGYPAEVMLTSGLIERPEGLAFGAISWQAQTPGRTQVEVRTRTGDLRRKVIRYFDRQGNQLEQKQWNNLLGSYKGPVDTAFAIGSDWSTWSRKYLSPGERITSPSLRGFLQIQVRLTTEDRFEAASIRSVEVGLLTPTVERVVGELWPTAVSEPGRVDTFDLFLRPFLVDSPLSARSRGFDELLLRMPEGNRLELLELDIGVDDGAGSSPVEYRRQGEGLASEQGGRLTVAGNNTDSVRTQLPTAVQGLPAAPGTRLYYRVTAAADQVPAGRDGELLTASSYGLLPPEERGDHRYFRKETDGTGRQRLVPVDEAAYDALPAPQREERYFRILVDEGGQFPFDAAGNALDEGGYRALAAGDRGRVVGLGPLLRARFAAPIYFNGTTLDVAVRNTSSGADPSAPWLGVEPGDANPQRASEALSVQIPLQARGLEGLALRPNPFTPNGDGRSDQTHILFEVYNLSAPRQARVRIYSLSGRRVWEQQQAVGSGTQSVAWSGTDSRGTLVPPGIYICQVELDIDARAAGHAVATRLVYVAY